MASGKRPEARRIGWIGTGKMGFPMSQNVLRAGFELAVLDVNPEPLAALAAGGATVCGNVAQVVERSDVIFTMLPDDEIVLKAVKGEPGIAQSMRPEQIYVDMSTISPLRSQEIASLLAQRSLPYLRAPVSGSTVSAASGQLGIFCSGPADAFESVAPLFAHIGRATQYLGTGEEARVMKLLINLMVGVMPVLVGEALAFGQRGGLEWSSMMDALKDSAVMSPLLASKLEMMRARDWKPMATINTIAKDMDLALEWGRRCNTPMPFTSLAQQTHVAFQGSGHGDDDFFSVLRWPERLLANNE